MSVICGMVATADGFTFQPAYGPDVYTSRSGGYCHRQPSFIPIDLDHRPDRTVGEVRFLAQRGRGLFMVGEIDDDILDWLPDPMYLSGEIEGRQSGVDFDNITLHAVGICSKSATVAKEPADLAIGTIDDAHLYHANQHRPLLKEAADYHRSRRFKPSYEEHWIAPLPMEQRDVQRLPNGTMLVDGEPAVVAGRGRRLVSVPDGRGSSARVPLEIRPGGRILAVR